ncbi:MAG: mechanosensitive ion channel family protein [Candidatus Bathyarchaeota archaeon]|nr:mechanosensitive ion channel family protein [Candidatus Bathyarchaeum tardum]WNZ29258.1 MAG: mechanosensitive ion channel family protein [Candidatus Bathyarchaeota archaeon]
MTLNEILSYTIFDNALRDYLLAITVFFVSLIVFKTIKYKVIKRLRHAADKTSAEIDNVIIKIVDNIGWHFYVFFATYLAINFIQLPVIITTIFGYATPIVVIFIIIKSLQQVVDYGIVKVTKEKDPENGRSVANVIGRISKVILWSLAFLYIITLFGYDMTTIVASFGVAGIVLAFGLQHVLSDIFASFSIFFDKPFSIGDFIIVGDNLGVVKKVGIRSTRIQSLWGEEVIIPNQELTSAQIHNYKKMERRRVQFNYGLIYSTSSEKLEKALEITKEVISSIELVEFDRVHFKEYGDFSLNFEVVYYVNTSDYNKYMDTQQEINLKLKKEFEKEKIEFAYPTQTVIINK